VKLRLTDCRNLAYNAGCRGAVVSTAKNHPFSELITPGNTKLHFQYLSG